MIPWFEIVFFFAMMFVVNFMWYRGNRKLQTRNRELTDLLGAEQRTTHRLYDLTHTLLKAFHIRPIDNPFVVEKLENGIVTDRNTICFHCRGNRFDGHAPSCIWRYIEQRIGYTHNGAMYLKNDNVREVHVGLRETL